MTLRYGSHDQGDNFSYICSAQIHSAEQESQETQLRGVCSRDTWKQALSACLDHVSRIVNIPDHVFILASLSSLMPGCFQVDPDTSCQRISLRKLIFQHCPKLRQQQDIKLFTPKGRGGLSSTCQKVRSLFSKQWPSDPSQDV